MVSEEYRQQQGELYNTVSTSLKCSEATAEETDQVWVGGKRLPTTLSMNIMLLVEYDCANKPTDGV